MNNPAVWGIILFAACRALELFLESQSLAALVAQAVLVEWGVSRLKVHWSPPDSGMTVAIVARRIGIGLAFGLTAAGLILVTLVASRAVMIESARPEPSVLVLGLLTAGLVAWRDEFLLHGIVLVALEGRPAVQRILACGVTSAGAAIGRADASARSVAFAAFFGVALGALWLQDGRKDKPGMGAWRPWAAHTGLRFAVGTLFAGGIFHSRLADNSWAGGSAGMLGGAAAVLALAPFAVIAMGWAARRTLAAHAD
jgi:hypothetical protein